MPASRLELEDVFNCISLYSPRRSPNAGRVFLFEGEVMGVPFGGFLMSSCTESFPASSSGNIEGLQ